MMPAQELNLIAAKAVANVDAWLRGNTLDSSMQHHAEVHLEQVVKLRDRVMQTAPELVLAVICLSQASIAASHARGDTELSWRAVAALQIAIIRSLRRGE